MKNTIWTSFGILTCLLLAGCMRAQLTQTGSGSTTAPLSPTEPTESLSSASTSSRSSTISKTGTGSASSMPTATGSIVAGSGSSSVSSGNNVIPPEETTPPESGGLGCFNNEGMWTNARSMCAANQKIHIENWAAAQGLTILLSKSESGSVDEEILGAMQSRFAIAENPLPEQRIALTQAIQAAQLRYEGLRTHEKASDATKEYFSSVAAWLQNAAAYFANENRTEADIQRMITTLKDIFDQTKALWIQEHPLASTTANVAYIFERTDLLLRNTRLALAELVQAGEEIEQSVIAAYISAQNRFDTLRAPCFERKQQCEDMDEVLYLLSTIKKPIEEAITRHPEIVNRLY